MGLEYRYDADYPFLNYITKRVDDPVRTLYDNVVFYSTVAIPLKLRPNDTLLDIGSCIGRMAKSVSYLKIKTFGVDLNLAALKIARNKFPTTSLSAQANAINLPFSSSSFNAVMSYDLLEHFDENQLKKAILEMDRVLNGDLMYHRVTTLEDSNIDTDESHQIKWSSGQWKKWFNDNGWEVLGKTTKRPALKTIYGNFLLKRRG